MATLYDKSLDQLKKHQWSLSPYTNLSLPSAQWRFGSWGSLWLSGEKKMSWLPVSNLDLTTIDGLVFPQMGAHLYYTIGSVGAARVRGKAVAQTESAIGAFDLDESVIDNVKAYSAESPQARVTGLDVVANTGDLGSGSTMRLKGTDAEQETESERIQVRENLQETAFFYPQLVADSTGGVSMKFTLPESLTTWRFMGLAHTVDLCR
jgi:hypothetical protein